MQRAGVHPGPACAGHGPGCREAPRGFVVDLSELRVAGALMLAAGLVISRLPGHPGLLCPLRAVTGIPCPLCGMTTSVVATMEGRLGDAFSAAPAGVLVVLVALLVLVVRRPQRIRVPVPLLLGALAAMWVFQLFRFQVL